MSDEIELDYEAIGRVLKTTLRPTMNRVTGQVARHAKANTDLPVIVRPYTTDRAASVVVLASPAGVAEQAKHGTLTRAAAAAGLEVTSE